MIYIHFSMKLYSKSNYLFLYLNLYTELYGPKPIVMYLINQIISKPV